MTPLINKNERDICDHMYTWKYSSSFRATQRATFHFHVSRYGGLTSLCVHHYIAYVDSLGNCIGISCYGGHTSKSSNIFTMTSRLHGFSSHWLQRIYISTVRRINHRKLLHLRVFSSTRYLCATVFAFCSDPYLYYSAFVCYIGACVYVCIYMEGYHILLYIEWKRYQCCHSGGQRKCASLIR